MSNLLGQNEKALCENIVKLGDVLNAKRAKALLFINEGNSHTKAAQDSNLSVGQVRYALAKYKSLGMAFFPTKTTVLKEKKAPIVNTATEIKKETEAIIPTHDRQTEIKEEIIEEHKPLNMKKDKKKEKVKKSKKAKEKKAKKDSKKKEKKKKKALKKKEKKSKKKNKK